MADDEELELIVPFELIAGEWANSLRVAGSVDEITIDFIRHDAFESRGIVVARIAGSMRFVGETAETLHGIWQTWVRNSMPPEVHGDDG